MTHIYVRAFKNLEDAFSSVGVAYPNRGKFLTEFEQALIARLRVAFPAAAHRGCQFHSTKCVGAVESVCRAAQIGAIRSLIRKLVTLAFLPLSEVQPGRSCVRRALLSVSKSVIAVLDYFDGAWMNRSFTPQQ